MFVLLDLLIKCCTVDIEMDGFVLVKTSLLRCYVYPLLQSQIDWGSYVVPLTKKY